MKRKLHDDKMKLLDDSRVLIPVGLSALAGAASEGASQIVKKISGKGVQTCGFLRMMYYSRK